MTEIGWSTPCDVWSIGCIAFELYSGYTLFQVTVLIHVQEHSDRVISGAPKIDSLVIRQLLPALPRSTLIN